MKGKGKYNEYEVVEQLQEKHDIRIQGNNIFCLRGQAAKCDVGIKSRGKIDFLVNYCGYFFTFVSKFN